MELEPATSAVTEDHPHLAPQGNDGCGTRSRAPSAYQHCNCRKRQLVEVTVDERRTKGETWWHANDETIAPQI
jgi:hypothetical protein